MGRLERESKDRKARPESCERARADPLTPSYTRAFHECSSFLMNLGGAGDKKRLCHAFASFPAKVNTVILPKKHRLNTLRSINGKKFQKLRDLLFSGNRQDVQRQIGPFFI